MRKENFKVNEWWDNVKSSNTHLTGVSGEDGGTGQKSRLKYQQPKRFQV